MKIIVSTILVVMIFGVCANSKSNQGSPGPIDHIIRLNRDGMMIDPTIADKGFFRKTNAPPLTFSEASNHLDQIFSNAELLGCENHKEKEPIAKITSSELSAGHYDNMTKDKCNILADKKSVKVKLPIYVHGGLNYFSHTDKLIRATAGLIMNGKPRRKSKIVVHPKKNLAIGTTHSMSPGRQTPKALGLRTPFVFGKEEKQTRF